ncbi:MAG: ABC transporter ATP-binding protein [Candidatus Binatia bacterium]|nr:ABC transporter ATP-binding protein [Candidatus Binatia bacterium]
MSDRILEATAIGKRFGDVAALDGVSLTCRAGEIHALLGENGAGKSTLMHVVCGLLGPDEGELRLRENVVRWRSADEARTAGIGMVHQHFMLVPTMTISENLALARRAFGVLDRAALGQEVRALAEQRGIEVGDPDRRIDELSVGEQQRVEILKALVEVPSLLILDEPTAVLTPSEVDDLFSMLRDLAQQGTAITIVTHKLAEVFAIADRVSVLRQGKLVQTGAASDFDGDSLARLMVGDRTSAKELAKVEPRPGEVRLKARALTWSAVDGRNALADVHLSVRSGEVVVIAGVDGNGQQELLDALVGIRAPELTGDVSIDGVPIGSPADARNAGLAAVPGDRRRDGMVGEMALWENLLLGLAPLRRAAPKGWMSPGREAASARELLRSFSVQPAAPEISAAALSGGNQQRLVLAREISREDLAVVVAANPTRGLDLVATRSIHGRLRALAVAGTAVLVLSTDLDEVEAIADRVFVLYRGRVRAVPGGAADRVVIGRLMAGLEEAA